MNRISLLRQSVLLVALVLVVAPPGEAQRGGRGARTAQPGTVSRVVWSEDGASLSFTDQGQRYRLDLATLEREKVEEKKPKSDEARPVQTRRRRGRGASGASTGKYVGRPTRGRQYTQVDSPDGV